VHTPWSNPDPLQRVRLAEKPCYLLFRRGLCPDLQGPSLRINEWEKYGVGKKPALRQCMAHCGI